MLVKRIQPSYGVLRVLNFKKPSFNEGDYTLEDYMVVSLKNITKQYHMQNYVVVSAHTPNSTPALHQYQRFAIQA